MPFINWTLGQPTHGEHIFPLSSRVSKFLAELLTTNAKSSNLLKMTCRIKNEHNKFVNSIHKRDVINGISTFMFYGIYNLWTFVLILLLAWMLCIAPTTHPFFPFQNFFFLKLLFYFALICMLKDLLKCGSMVPYI